VLRAPAGPGDPPINYERNRTSLSNMTELATGQLNRTALITIELVEVKETPAVVIVRWPSKPTVLHPRRFPGAAEIAHGHSLLPLSGWRTSDGSVSCDPVWTRPEPATAVAKPTRGWPIQTLNETRIHETAASTLASPTEVR
jgi:hypothetical protein